MIDTPSAQPPQGPILLCAGTDADAAAHLAEAAAVLLEHRPTVVLATWQSPPVVVDRMIGLSTVMDTLDDGDEELRDEARHAAEQTARAAGDVLDRSGMHVTRQVRPEDHSPWRMILQLADEIDAAVIVAGTSERDAHHLGKQARALAHRSHRPLLLLPTDGTLPRDAAPAIFATDGSAPATRAAQIASVLLHPRPAVVASAWRPVSLAVGVAMVAVRDEIAHRGAGRMDKDARLRAAGRSSEAVTALTQAGWNSEATTIESVHNVPTTIAADADERRAAVIVTGTRGRSRMAAALLGSSAEGILRQAGRPVLLVAPVPDAD